MILIADSGSSKCDWAFFESDNNEIKTIKTIGFNPYFINSERIIEELNNSTDLLNISKCVKKVFFYGAGCSDDSKKNILNKVLSIFFVNAEIIIEHDLLGACRSIYNNGTTINCIIGTGSIACIYNDGKVKLSVPSLGYILGDEGSGNYFGKKLLNLYLTKQLTQEIEKDFEKSYNFSYELVMKKVYNNERSNYFLSSFFPFFIKHKKNPLFFNILKEGILEFLNIHVFSISKYQDYKINFFGSVSLQLKDIIVDILKERKCNIGLFVNKPIYGLFDYHYKK